MHGMVTIAQTPFKGHEKGNHRVYNIIRTSACAYTYEYIRWKVISTTTKKSNMSSEAASNP